MQRPDNQGAEPAAIAAACDLEGQPVSPEPPVEAAGTHVGDELAERMNVVPAPVRLHQEVRLRVLRAL